MIDSQCEYVTNLDDLILIDNENPTISERKV